MAVPSNDNLRYVRHEEEEKGINNSDATLRVKRQLIDNSDATLLTLPPG